MVAAEKAGGDIYEGFAALLTYPKENISELVQGCIDAVLAQPGYPASAASELKTFQKGALEMPLDDLQGYFSYTFEMSADHTLDLGFYLFDGFKRTNTLVAIKEMYKANGFPYEAVSRGELPDNLVVILKFLAGLEDEELKREFRESFLIKALEKMAKNFESKQENVYSHLIRALLAVIDTDVKAAA